MRPAGSVSSRHQAGAAPAFGYHLGRRPADSGHGGAVQPDASRQSHAEIGPSGLAYDLPAPNGFRTPAAAGPRAIAVSRRGRPPRGGRDPGGGCPLRDAVLPPIGVADPRSYRRVPAWRAVVLRGRVHRGALHSRSLLHRDVARSYTPAPNTLSAVALTMAAARILA